MLKKGFTSKNALLASGISLVLCFAMLVGTTFAWFSDSVSNKGNRIQAGNLNVQMYKYTGAEGGQDVLNADWTEITDETDSGFIFGNEFKNWAPGTEKTIYLAVKNAGSLDFKYNLDLIMNNDSLSDALLFGCASGKATAQGISAPATTALSSVIKDGVIEAAPNGQLSSTEVEYIAVTVKFLESSGNTYQGAELDLDVVLTATQKNAEIVKAYAPKDLENVPANATIKLMKDITLQDDVTITAANIDAGVNEMNLDGHKLTFAETSTYTTIDAVGKFTNGTIILNNSQGHFNLTGLSGTTATIDAQATFTKTAFIKGIWGDITVNTGSDSSSSPTHVVICKDAVVQNVIATGEGNVKVETGAKIEGKATGNVVNSETGLPFTAIVIDPSVGNKLYEKLNAQNAPDGTTIVLKEGTYEVGTTITVSTSITVIGEGNVIIKKVGSYSKSNRHVINCSSDKVGKENRIKVVFKNITVDGSNLTASDATKTKTAGIQAIRNSAVYLYDVTVKNCTQSALSVNASTALIDGVSLTDAYVFADDLTIENQYVVDSSKAPNVNAYFYYNNLTYNKALKPTFDGIKATKASPADWPNPWA